MVDAGTVELVRNLGVEIHTSADLVQHFEARWNQAQLNGHLEAGRRVDKIRQAAFEKVAESHRSAVRITEWEIQQFIRQSFTDAGMFTDHGPIVAVNDNASDCHYEPTVDAKREIKPGDWVLIDLWAKLDHPDAVYYDVTWTGYCGTTVPEEIRSVFDIVVAARDSAVKRVLDAVAAGQSLHGFEVDDTCRAVIAGAGFGQYFVHRTGHSIGREVHGTGANMDNLETHDDRRIIPWTCFSVEPGIYLPKFGVRSEVNVFVGEDKAIVTGAVQTEPVAIA
jgi:Xaa-Pro aminopeptidase